MPDRYLRRLGASGTAARVAVPATVRRGIAVALSVVGAIAAWQAVVVATDLPQVILPSPGAVAGSAITHADSIRLALQYTAVEVFLGWIGGVTVGVVLAGLMATSVRLRRLFYPLLVAVRIVPLVVLAPVLVVVLGPTRPTRILLATILAFFPVTVATLDGLLSTSDDQLALMRSVGAPRWKRFAFVRVPNALPSVFAGLEIATPLAIEGVVIAEFLAASGGLGVAMLTAANRLQTARLFATMLVLVAFGVVLFGMVRTLHGAVSWEETADSFGAAQLDTADDSAVEFDGRTVVALGGATVVLVAGWQVLALAVPDARLFLGRPAAVVDTLVSTPGLFVSAAAATLRKLVVGWLLGAGVGLSLGALAALVPRTRIPVFTYLAGFRVMPVIAFAPVLLVWLGVSFEGAVVLVAAATVFPIAVGAATGLRRLPRAYDDLLASVDAPIWRSVLIRVRYGIPELFAGVKLSTITALSGVVIAEWFVASDGLGVLVLQQTRTFQPALSFAAIAVLFALGSTVFGLTALVQAQLQW